MIWKFAKNHFTPIDDYYKDENNFLSKKKEVILKEKIWLFIILWYL